MREINKVDYFCGAFLSYLISNGVEPTLFEAGEKNKAAVDADFAHDVKQNSIGAMDAIRSFEGHFGVTTPTCEGRSKPHQAWGMMEYVRQHGIEG